MISNLEDTLGIDGYKLKVIRIESDIQAVIAREPPRTSFDSKVQEQLNNKGMVALHSGMPDLVISTPSGPVFVEVKGPNDRLSSAQMNTLTGLANMGFNVVVAKYERIGSKLNGNLIRNPRREAVLKRTTWGELLESYGAPVPEGTSKADSMGDDEMWPVIGPRGRAGVYHRKNGIIDYGHNAIRRANVAIFGDQRKYS